MKEQKLLNVHILGKRWCNKLLGGTHHNVKVGCFFSDGSTKFFESGITYGYENQYIQTAESLLIDNGLELIPNYTNEAVDVPREKDLKF